ncbi:MAG: Crp/Fnr family transcriptional regulator [Bacillota bacterium]|nr:Crp/Fnr family transcriptional regulator [Bacillota bacterium]
MKSNSDQVGQSFSELLLAALPQSESGLSLLICSGQLVSDEVGGIASVGIVRSGRIDVYSVAPDGRDVQLNSLYAGDCFGISNLLAEAELPTMLKCGEHAEVIYIAKARFQSLLRSDAQLALAYAELCNQKIQFLLRRIELLTIQSCRGKLIAFFLSQPDVAEIVLHGSREDLAARIGVSRATLFRELSALQSMGLIHAEASVVRILDRDALEDLLYHPK